MSDGRPRAGRRLCALQDIDDPGARSFRFEADADAAQPFRGFVVRRGDAVQGWVDACPHTGAPLSAQSDRYLDRSGAWILCFSHGAMFRLDDGLCVAGPCVDRSLRAWPVRVEGSDVFAA